MFHRDVALTYFYLSLSVCHYVRVHSRIWVKLASGS